MNSPGSPPQRPPLPAGYNSLGRGSKSVLHSSGSISSKTNQSYPVSQDTKSPTSEPNYYSLERGKPKRPAPLPQFSQLKRTAPCPPVVEPNEVNNNTVKERCMSSDEIKMRMLQLLMLDPQWVSSLEAITDVAVHVECVPCKIYVSLTPLHFTLLFGGMIILTWYSLPHTFILYSFVSYSQESIDADWRREERTWPENEKDGSRNGTSIWDEGQRKEAETKRLWKWCKFLLPQGGHGTGKTGNLVLTFSRQGKHREFCFDTGKIFETQGKYFSVTQGKI